MDRPRLFRGLRIAVSAVFGILCVLLIVLCVRSYSTVDSVRCAPFGRMIHIQSGSGRIIAFTFPNTFPHSNEQQIGSIPIEHIGPIDVLTTAVIGRLYTPTVYKGWSPVAVVPYWAAFVATAVAAFASQLSLHKTSWSFSLRTLLIATTLVAVLLGAVVYAIR